MTFLAQYPLYVVVKHEPDNIALIDLTNGAAKAKGLAVFTDKEGAEEFRDRYHGNFIVETLSDEAAFARLLTALESIVSEVVFYPYVVGKHAQTITVAEMLEQLPR